MDKCEKSFELQSLEEIIERVKSINPTVTTIGYDGQSHKYTCTDSSGKWESSDGLEWTRTRELASTFVKNDSGKLQWSLLPFAQLEDVVKVLMKGAEKYSRGNWKNCDDINRYKDALMRHVTAYIKGEKIDIKAKGGDDLPHLAHAICNCLFLMYFDEMEDEKDVESE